MFKNSAIYVHCKSCESDQSFQHADTLYSERADEFLKQPFYKSAGIPAPDFLAGEVIHLDFLCLGCNEFHRHYSIKIKDDFTSLMKVGQYPPYDITVPSHLSKALGKENTNLYKKGLICESQGYGIAAYAYYRRIVELIIDQLLDDIYNLIEVSDPNKELYEKALSETKNQPIAQDKIKLIKDLLPPSLKPEGVNPMDTLYSTLSEGLHSSSDEDCIEIADIIKRSLIFLVTEVIRSQQEKKEFTDGIKALLEKRAKKN